MIHQAIPRRTFLRGLGTAVALPMLEAMLPSPLLAASQARRAVGRAAPVRMAFVFVPNGAHMEDWTPHDPPSAGAPGSGFDLPFILEPLKPVKDDLMVLTGLAHDKARPNGDGPGDHARSVAAFLTGCQPRKTAGADIRAGISVDQVAARVVGKQTRFPSLEIGCERGAQAGNCDSGYSCAYSSNISWRSETTPMAKEVDPRLVFERLFGNGDPKEMDESQGRRERYRKSILDMVLEDANRLKAQLGAKDQQKLDEYLTGVREIERRLARVDPLAGPTWQSDVVAPGTTKPTGIPQDFGEHIRLMCDMMLLAFQADLTRVCTFMIANDGSNRPYQAIGIPEGHHDLSHHGGDPAKHEKIRRINQYHMSQFAYLLEKMKSVREGDRTLLDNTMIVYGCAIGDGNRHNHDNLPVLLAGRGGGVLKSGRHVRCERETPMTNLFLAMLDILKVPATSLGDSTGPLTGLTG